MSDGRVYEQPLVFGLDIGTRNVVGTVGYRSEDTFVVVAQHMIEHETRAMLDGQIHDIGRVGRSIGKVKEKLEEQAGQPLTEVCIAAAGRVLKTVTTNIAHEFKEETVVTGEDIHTLDLLGIEKAQDILKEMNDTKYKFYCVGYSVVKYYLNDEPFNSLESHKAEKISEDVIVTFLPEDVVDGLYAAVGLAGLSVANMTLEPIAAINVAIPENYRLLNIALVDIGAGTSDISVTRDGSIIAYGMIPLAGDEITELIVQHYLVDFKTAEQIKLCSGTEKEITYKDIMLIEHTIPAEEVWELTKPIVDKMTTEVAEKIKELNGDKSVSATFVVGGGGKIHGYTQMLAEKLGLPEERVALRGEEVLQNVIFEQGGLKKDPLLVTPVGICLNYYDQRNSFIMVRFNGERIKLYDNNKLTIVDAALQAGFPNEDLFPKRGKELQFTVNGVTRVVRGEPGESAAIFMNDRPTNINTPLEPNSDIIIEPSTQGEGAVCILEQLDEYTTSTVTFVVNGRIVRCPRFLEVNGSLEMPSYQIKEGDIIETRGFYTVGQLAEFMDIEIDMDRAIVVNNRAATMETLIYENFTIEWTILSYGAAAVPPESLEIADFPFLKDNNVPEKKEIDQEDMEGAAPENNTPQTAAVTDSKAHNLRAEELENPENLSEVSEPQEEELKTSSEASESQEEEPKTASEVSEPQEEELKTALGASEPPEEELKTSLEASEPQLESEESLRDELELQSAASGLWERSVSEEVTGVQPEKAFYDASEKDFTENPMNNDLAEEILEIGEKSSSFEKMESGLEEEEELQTGTESDGLLLYINQQPVRLTGKDHYIFVDIFDYYDFDLSASAGRAIITNLNGRNAQFSAVLKAGDQIELGWKEN